MKDIQGIQRGKCNSLGCECEEYRTSLPEKSTDSGERRGGGGKVLCEYCDHSPVQHVKIIELGECKACGKDNCSKYEFDDPNSYSNCAYCDCPASQHAGAEKLRKPQPPAHSSVFPGQPQASMMAPGQSFSPSVSIQPGMTPYRQPTHAPNMGLGTCKVPGCPFPKRVEGNTVHDFCSRTCAKKYSSSQFSTQGGFASIQTGPVPTTMGGPVPQRNSYPMSQSQPRPALSIISTSMMTSSGSGPSSAFRPPPTGAGGGSQTTPGPVFVGQVLKQMCKNCQKNPANPGHSWCQSCFQQQ